MLNFVEHHASNLRYIMLTDFTLDGCWFQFLHWLADLIRGKLEYLSILWPKVSQMRWNRLISDNAESDKYRNDQWPQFSCATNFMPSLNLLPSLSDEGNVEHGVSENGGSTSTEHDNIRD